MVKINVQFDKPVSDEKRKQFMAEVDRSVYYLRKEKRNEELVRCWVYATLVGAAILAAVGLIYYGHKLGHWLFGGC